MYNLKVVVIEQIFCGYLNDVDVYILVKNVNEYYFYFFQKVYEKFISEDVGLGVLVFGIIVYDCDCIGCKCENVELKYLLEGISVFKIDEVIGLISVGDMLFDYEI